MEFSPLVIQLFGAIGYLLLANSYFSKKKERLLIVQIISNVFLTIHYLFLAGLAGAICDIVCIFAGILIYLHDKFNLNLKKALAVVLVLIMVISVFITFKLTNTSFSFKEIFPMFATIMVVVSLVSNNKNLIRLVGLVAAICWLVYGIVFGSIAGIIFEIIIIASTLISYIRGKMHPGE